MKCQNKERMKGHDKKGGLKWSIRSIAIMGG